MEAVSVPETTRYFTSRPGAAGARYFWQPSKALQQAGWRLHRLPDDRRQAIDRALALNAALDAWRRGEAPIGVPTPATLVEPRTLAAVIRAYKASRFWEAVRPRTRRAYQQNIDFLESWAGDRLVAAITPATVEVLYTSLRVKTPSKAAAVITMLRILLQHAVKMNLVATNAASRAGIKGRPPSGRIWPREAVRLFVAAADEAGWHSVGTAVTLAHWFGQREGDVLALPRTAVTGARLDVRQSKTGARVSIPETPAVRARLDSELARQDKRAADVAAEGATLMPASTLLVCETTGRPWSEHHFRHVFADIRAALAKAHPAIAHADGTEEQTGKLLFMHLRHTAVTELSIAGVTPQQITSITGHSLATVTTILSRYLVVTSELADVAAAKRNAYDAARMLVTFQPERPAPAAAAPRAAPSSRQASAAPARD
jgi:hypothetical protein